MQTIPASELPLSNGDKAVYHLALQPEQLADKIVMVGDPARVMMLGEMLDSQECKVEHREYITITGTYKGKRVTILSHGMGTGNIDIVMNELDALANVDFKTRTIKPEKKSLTIVRVGTCGGLQPNTPLGTFVLSEKSMGFDGVLNFYAGRNEVCDVELEKEFVKQVNFSSLHASPYVAISNKELLGRINQGDMVGGVTISASGFFGPQGRVVRIPLDDPELNSKIESFEFKGQKITNFEMEGSLVLGLSSLMGHKATVVCCVVANRLDKGMNVDYNQRIKELATKVLDRI
ncbi:MAG TPA: phosphorylase [Porphyromonadaceae bacterium]|nr:phosphorylase [Porphyromonadaceae bacterium]